MPRKKKVAPKLAATALPEDVPDLSRGIFPICGRGTYVIVGPTQSGKNSWLEYQIREGAQWLNLSNVLIFSTTGKLNSDWDFLQPVTGATVTHSSTFSTINGVLATMTNRLIKWKEQGRPVELWLHRHRTLFIVNDYFGMGCLSAPSNPFNTLASKVRHLGGILVVFTQHSSSLNPGLYTNSAAVVSFDASTRVTKHLNEVMPVDVNVSNVVEHNMKPYHHTLFLFGSRSGTVLYCEPVPLPE